jgi:hypothetical protein
VHIPDRVNILGCQEKLSTQMTQNRLVELGIMHGENSLDVLPLSDSGRDPRTAKILGPVDEVIHREDIFSFIVSLYDGVFVAAWMSGCDAI